MGALALALALDPGLAPDQAEAVDPRADRGPVVALETPSPRRRPPSLSPRLYGLWQAFWSLMLLRLLFCEIPDVVGSGKAHVCIVAVF